MIWGRFGFFQPEHASCPPPPAQAFRFTKGSAARAPRTPSQVAAAAAAAPKEPEEQPDAGPRRPQEQRVPRLPPEHLGDRRLRCLIVGHNPSAHAWASGHYYSNPTNWMWRLLRETGIAPPGIRSACLLPARDPLQAGPRSSCSAAGSSDACSPFGVTTLLP